MSHPSTSKKSSVALSIVVPVHQGKRASRVKGVKSTAKKRPPSSPNLTGLETLSMDDAQQSSLQIEDWTLHNNKIVLFKRGAKKRDNIEASKEVLQQLNNPLFRKWIKPVASTAAKAIESAVHGVAGVVAVGLSFGLDGDIVVDVVFAVIDTMLSGIGSIMNAAQTIDEVLQIPLADSWYVFRSNIMDMYDQYRRLWLKHPLLNDLRASMYSNAKKLINLITGWVSTIAGWVSVIVPDDAGAVKIVTDMSAEVIKFAAELAKPELMLAVFEKVLNMMVKMFSLVTDKVVEQNMKLIETIAATPLSKLTDGMKKIPLVSDKLKQSIAGALKANETHDPAKAHVEQTTSWLVSKSLRLLITLVDHYKNKPMTGFMIPNGLTDDLLLIHYQAPWIVSGVFNLTSIIVGLCALASIASTAAPSTPAPQAPTTEGTSTQEETDSEESE